VSRWIVEELETDLDHFHLGPVDLDLVPGSVIAVLGPSGAGKTTLLRTLAGFLRARQGRILRDGVDISDWAPEERALGYVPQGLGLLPHRTVAGNIRYPMELRERPRVAQRTQELLDRFHLTPLAKRFPARLSGGEQQRVAIARALAADPGMIVWDEPWQALDVVARYELGLVLHELRETDRIPVVVVTHDPSLAFSVADSFVVLHRGQVRKRCDASTLLRTPSDAFAARFVGYENVYDRAALDGGASGSLRVWLRERSGVEGVAFSSPVLWVDRAAEPHWEGWVRSARPGPSGLAVEMLSDELLVTLRIPPPVVSPLPTIGERVRFRIDPASVMPLGSSSASGVGT
jgi:ABC-type Fe3+/spermidine/putrescine transport system ATPase subunit